MDTEQQTNTKQSSSFLSTPVAILIGFVMVSGVLIYNNQVGNSAGNQSASANDAIEANPLDNVKPISDRDHVLGNRDADVVIVEYSDFECPFCQRHHGTLHAIVEKYDGEVAWVYRHFPLEQLHPVKARRASVASECAYDQGGDDMFWAFTDMYYERTLTNNRTNQDELFPQMVSELGLNAQDFAECLESGKHDALIQAHYDEAASTGGRGTPWSIVIAPNGDKGPINGAQDQATIEAIIEIAKQRR
ncbi:MAG: DsbA family protein [Candidatus Paceibacterota bacterium]